MKLNNDDIYAIIGAVAVHLILFLILYFGVLKTIVLEEERTIYYLVSDASGATGMNAPDYPNVTSPPLPTSTPPRRTTPQPARNQRERLITQNREESVSIPEDAKKEETDTATVNAQREREEAERRQREEDARRRIEEQQRQQAERIANQTASSFRRSGSQESGQDAATTGTSNQGNPFANSNAGSNAGSGVLGSFNLDGRSIYGGGLPTPNDTGQEVGRIVINITVDSNGNVISADIGRGTNIGDSFMRNSALEAAKRAKFSRIQKPDNQTGTITYNYRIKQ